MYLDADGSAGKSAIISQPASDLSPTYESEEKKYAAEEKVVTEEKPHQKQQITQELVDEFMKDTEAPFESKIKENLAQEKVPEEYVGKTEVVEETITKTVAEKSKEEIINEEISERPQMKKEPSDDCSTLKKDDVPEKDIIDSSTTTSTTTTTFEDGSQSVITTKTTNRQSFIIEDDGGVQEKIVIEKRTDSAQETPRDEKDKSDMLQKLGEELGKLDDRLEEKFQKKRDEQPLEGKHKYTVCSHLHPRFRVLCTFIFH